MRAKQLTANIGVSSSIVLLKTAFLVRNSNTWGIAVGLVGCCVQSGGGVWVEEQHTSENPQRHFDHRASGQVGRMLLGLLGVMSLGVAFTPPQ